MEARQSMKHAPIYRSTTPRRTTTSASLIPWQRTASLASAVAALTVSGIALGYHGFATVTSATVATVATPPTAAAAAPTVAAPVPGIPLAIADGGHPDLISTLSSAMASG